MYSNTYLIQSKSAFYLQQSAHRVLTYFHEFKASPFMKVCCNVMRLCQLLFVNSTKKVRLNKTF